MFAWWGGTAVRLRWWVLGATAALVVTGAVWGIGVFGVLAGGGFDDPASGSSVANARIESIFGSQGPDVVVLYTSPFSTVDTLATRDAIQGALQRLDGRPEVVSVRSYDTTRANTMVSRDRHATYATIQLRDGGVDAKRRDLRAIRPLPAAGGDVQTRVGGAIGFADDANSQVKTDIVRAEVLSLPVLPRPPGSSGTAQAARTG